jgi:quercetin dioxygenase-like cupin family protein
MSEAEAEKLVDLVEYAEGSIVSRTIADGDEGTLTLFAFDRGQSLSEHTAPYDAHAIVIDGQAEFTIGGRVVTTGAGEMVLMPAGVPHAVRAPERFKMLLVMIRAQPAD